MRFPGDVCGCVWRRAALRIFGLTSVFCICFMVLASSGCKRPTISQPLELAEIPTNETLNQRLDEVLEAIYKDRHLNLRDHAAWQILHGALTYKRDFMVERNGKFVSAVDYILNGGQMKGWTVEQGVELSPGSQRFGLRALLEEGTKAGQGHADQWLAVLAQCDLSPEQKILVAGDEYTMESFLRQVQYDVPRNTDREYSWTLIGLTTYLPTNETWTALDGEEWNIERLVGIEAEQALASSACGGTHRLIGMATALNHHVDQQFEVTGAWKQASEVIEQAKLDAKKYQNVDGSFSTNYFQRPGRSPDLAQNLGTTGHILEFLAIALQDEQLEEPWVKRAVANMCELFEKTRDVPLECGALYHAAHGLALYRERVFGPRNYRETESDAQPANTPAAANDS